MQHRLGAMILLMAMLAGCGSPADRLAGRWKCNLLDEAARSAPAGLNGAAAAGMFAQMGMKLEMEIDFRRDGTLNVTAAAPMAGLTQGGGYWSVAEAKDDTLLVDLRRAKDDEPSQMKVAFVDADSFLLSSTQEGSPALTFTRVKDK
jgi:hypothetical protein